MRKRGNAVVAHVEEGVVRRVPFVALLLFSAGCAGSDSYLAWQVKHARAIPDPQGRAAATAAVARSAAYTGDVSMVSTALRDLRDDPRHDEVAAECALHLGQAGHAADGRRVATRISDPVRRREVLDKLVEKTEPEPANTTPP
jgi:hypothetical protein